MCLPFNIKVFKGKRVQFRELVAQKKRSLKAMS